jgi:D-glycero-D-manno-heptose 1,7-bisphosphate phosphatase
MTGGRRQGTGGKRAVFLDRDGVLIASKVRHGKPLPALRLDELMILPGVSEALAELQAAGYVLIGVTNQPDVGRGLLSREVVETMHQRLLARLPLTDILVCYETDDACPRRKPNPGMLLEAADRYGITLPGSFLVGDRWKDIEAGRRAGCRTVFVDHDYAESRPDPPADFTTDSLSAAARWVLTSGVRDRESECRGEIHEHSDKSQRPAVR